MCSGDLLRWLHRYVGDLGGELCNVRHSGDRPDMRAGVRPQLRYGGRGRRVHAELRRCYGRIWWKRQRQPRVFPYVFGRVDFISPIASVHKLNVELMSR